MPASNGGTAAPLNLLLYPVTGLPPEATFFYTFDPTNFNDPLSSSFYSLKIEDVIAGRTPTISRVIISYRDLGVATFTVTLSGTDDSGAAINSSTPVTIGSVAAPGIIKTVLPGIALTAQNLQLSVTRAANGGPVSITKVRMEGRVEMTVY
jgi:hypothetical protein